MTGRRAVVGLALLSVFLSCTFAAQGAAAVTTSKNTTSFTCVKTEGKSGDFTDPHCDTTGTIGKSEYKHELIPLDTTTEVDATNSGVTESTKKSEPAILKSTINLVKVEIECAVVKGIPKNSTQHNVEPAAGQHTLTGSAVAEWTKCNVNPKSCIVAEPIVASTAFFGVEGLEGPKGEKNAMAVEYIGTGPEETFAEIEFKNNGTESCGANGAKAKIKGKVYGTSGPTTESGQESKESGSTIALTSKFKMQELKLGKEPAEFSVIVVPTMAGGGNPISITTTT